MVIENLSGKQFNRLIAINIVVIDKPGTHWLCQCKCGNKSIVSTKNLKAGAVKSCGCLLRDNVLISNKQRSKHNDCNTSFYYIWRALRNRCDNIKSDSYKYYGKRGIAYDNSWIEYLKYKNDMYFKYIYALKKYRKVLNRKNPLSIERLDVNGNYNFNNCVFIPRNDQYKNRRF
jgi:hypothetical protein